MGIINLYIFHFTKIDAAFDDTERRRNIVSRRRPSDSRRLFSRLTRHTFRLQRRQTPGEIEGTALYHHTGGY